MSKLWHVYTDLTTAAAACATFVTATILQEVADHGRATIALSGGSSPKPLFVALANSAIPWSQTHVFWVDERCVPPSDPQSNFKLADELLLQPASVPLANIHRIMAELPPEDAARRYAAELREFFGLSDGQMPQFSVIHQGMGPDGHTASLFPGEPLIDDRKGLTAAVWVEKMKSHRVTLLPGVLLAAKHTVFLANGGDKREMLDTILNDKFNPHEYPAQLFARECPDVQWFLDAPIAELLGT